MNDITPMFPQDSTPAESPVPPTRQKSLAIAYVLAICLGWLGIHRFYLGNVLMGLMYMFSFGGFGIGWLLDMILLPRIVAKANARQANPPTSQDVLLDDSEIVADPSLNPLRSSISVWRWTKYAFFCLMMAMIPYMYYSFFGDLTFAFILILLYFVAVYNKAVAGYMANQNFFLWKIPGIRSRMVTIVNGFAELRRYYASRRPSGILRSMFSVFLIPFSADVRREWKLFNALLAFGMIFVIFQLATWGYEYFTLYQPELTLANLLFDIKLVNIAVGAVITLVFVIPIVRTLTYVELSGDVKNGRILVICATIGVLLFPFLSATETYPHEEYQRLKLRVEKSPAFKKKVMPFLQQFLSTHFRPGQFSATVVDDGKKSTESRLKQSRLSLTTSIRLTRLLRQQLVNKKLVFRSEVNGFRVLAFHTQRMGAWHPALLLYLGYGDEDVDWYLLTTERGSRTLKDVVPIQEVGRMYRILLERMKAMDKGDQLSPDFQGKTPEIKGTPAGQPLQTTTPRKAAPWKAPPKQAAPRETPPRKPAPTDEGDSLEDDL